MRPSRETGIFETGIFVQGRVPVYSENLSTFQAKADTLTSYDGPKGG